MNNRIKNMVSQILFVAGLLALTSIATAEATDSLATVHVNNPTLVAGSANAEPAPIFP